MSKHHRHGPGYRTVAHASLARRHSLLALCVAASLSATAHAQQATEAATELDAVQVSGIRGSVYRAQDIKRDAETFVDSVTALDIGALPDRSVTETLPRTPGGTLDHFPPHGDPEHSSAEGAGVAGRRPTP